MMIWGRDNNSDWYLQMKNELLKQGVAYVGLAVGYCGAVYAHYKITETILDKAFEHHIKRSQDHRDRLAVKKAKELYPTGRG